MRRRLNHCGSLVERMLGGAKRFALRLLREHAIVLAAGLLLLALPALPQSSTGRIFGAAMDAQGGAIPNAKITIINISTNVRAEVVTNDEGAYQVLDLPVGTYTVAVEHEGFSKVVTDPQSLEINQSLRIDVHLRVGPVVEVITVKAQAMQVETINPTIGATVTGAPIQDLPLNGRATLDLALTQPGVVPAPVNSVAYGGAGFTIAGGRPDSITYLLDGGLNNSVTGNDVVFSPNPDTIEEFRILTNNYTAEFGRNGGGTISVVTKSGTNSFHGSLYDYLRNDAFDANDFFANEQGQPRSVLKRNQFGGTVGGPVTLPKLVNGKDRFFFFFGYQGQRQTQTLLGSAVTTYTPSELSGNFSGNQRVIDFLAGHPYFVPAGGSAQNGIIDAGKFDPVAKAFIAAGLIPTSPTGILFPRGRATDNVNEYTGKFDFHPTLNDRISMTIGSSKEPTLNPFSTTLGQPDVPGYPDLTSITNQLLNIGYTKTFSPTLLNEFHATAARFYNTSTAASTPPVPPALGVNINSDLETGPPILSFAGGLNIGFNQNVPRSKADNTYVISDSLTWTRGRQTWKGGFRFASVQENSAYGYETNGGFLFSGAQGIGSGNDLADFLSGASDNYQQYAHASNNERQKQYSAFVQDEWKLTQRLTLTLGLRYEYSTPETDTKGYSFSILPGLQSSRFENAPLGLVFPGDKGAPTGWYLPDRTNFAPRFGFAWDPFGKGSTSVRGGAGVFYDALNGWMSDWNNGVRPWYPSAYLTFAPNQIPVATAPGPSGTILSNPYGNACVNFDSSSNCITPYGVPDPFPSTPPPRNLDFSAEGYFPYGTGELFVNPHLKTPYIYQYNLNIEQQLGTGLMAEIGYVGSSSHKLLTWLDENPVVPGTTNRLLNVKEGLTPSNGFAPLITFDGLNNANYNAFLASLTKRMADVAHIGPMFFTLSYTWSHTMDNGSGFNQRSQQIPYYYPHKFYSNSDFDIRNRLVLSGGWELPIARFWSGGPRRLTTGWSLYPIFILQSGTPIDIYLNTVAVAGESDPSPSGAGDPQLQRPDQLVPIVKTLNPHSSSGNYWFNPNDFGVDPCIAANTCPLGFYGTFQRNSIFGPGRVNLDLALEKSTNRISDQMKVVFRIEAFNIFNHTEFQNPSSDSFSSGTLGQISTAYPPRILQLALRLVF